jgi:hypothetical protein
MKPSNPACYECPKGSGGLHAWQRNPDMTATCLNCDTVLSVEHATDAFRSFEEFMRKARDAAGCPLCDAVRITNGR